MAGRHRARAGVIRQALALVVPVVGAVAVATAIVLGSARFTGGAASAVTIPSFPPAERSPAMAMAVSDTPFAAHRASDVASTAVTDASNAVTVRLDQERAGAAQRAAEHAAAQRAAARAAAAERSAEAAARARPEPVTTRPAPRVAPAPAAPARPRVTPRRSPAPTTTAPDETSDSQTPDTGDSGSNGGLLGGLLG